MRTPVLLVHGIWDSSRRLDPLRRGLQARGLLDVTALDLAPNDGRAPLDALAAQVAGFVAARWPGVPRIDVVGFSMGALVTRCWIQRHGGSARVRRFVSVSGPHRGTLAAWGLPHAGVREMRPGSALLRALDADEGAWGDVEVHCLYTPWDLMVTPAETAVLPRARSVTALPVKLHRWMITDPRALDAIAERLRG